VLECQGDGIAHAKAHTQVSRSKDLHDGSPLLRLA